MSEPPASASLLGTFNIVWVAADHGTGVEVTATADKSVKYDGAQVEVSQN